MGSSGGRRGFFIKAAQTGAYALAGGLIWGALIQESKAQPFALRPPGALPEAAYRGTCIRCGQCVDACPFETLALTRAGEGGAPGLPRFKPRQTPCYMCKDVPCARACPTGALEAGVEIDRARMGLAVLIDQENCLAFQGLRCEICYRVCPLIDKAIRLRYRPQLRTGKHAFFEPVVDSKACTGCGMCEHACPLEATAIKVLPHGLAQGRISSGYRFGWKEKSSLSRDFKPADARPGEEVRRWQKNTLKHALDSLNDVESVYDGLDK